MRVAASLVLTTGIVCLANPPANLIQDRAHFEASQPFKDLGLVEPGGPPDKAKDVYVYRPGKDSAFRDLALVVSLHMTGGGKDGATPRTSYVSLSLFRGERAERSEKKKSGSAWDRIKIFRAFLALKALGDESMERAMAAVQRIEQLTDGTFDRDHPFREGKLDV